jgi:glycosyltransferase involved in cell wall biosynthesis
MNPLVTVVIPCFNYAQYLAEAVDSALGQRYPRIEVVVVDDGSTDDTLAVLEAYGESIRVLTQERGGPARARNRGAAVARGEFIVFLDADDVLEDAFVERCLTPLQSDSTLAFTYCQTRFFGASSGVSAWPEYDLERLKLSNFINVSALIRADVVRRLPFDPRLRLGLEDWDFYLGLAELGWAGARVNEPLLRYRRHSESRSARMATDYASELSAQASIVRKHRALYSAWGYSRLQGKLLRRQLKLKLKRAIGLDGQPRVSVLPGERGAT